MRERKVAGPYVLYLDNRSFNAPCCRVTFRTHSSAGRWRGRAGVDNSALPRPEGSACRIVIPARQASGVVLYSRLEPLSADPLELPVSAVVLELRHFPDEQLYLPQIAGCQARRVVELVPSAAASVSYRDG